MTDKKYKCLKSQIYSYESLVLESINKNYIENIRVWRNNQIEILRQKKTITRLEQKKYFDSYIFNDMGKTPNNILFNIFYDGLFIGYGGLVHISWNDKRAEISFLLDPKISHSSKKYEDIFNRFLYLIKCIAFAHLSLNKLFTETYEFRSKHIKILQKNMFKQEGLLIQHNIINKRFVNSIIHGCLNEK